MKQSLPKETSARRIGREAEKLFEHSLDTTCFLEHRIPLERDFGLDYRIELISDGELQGHEFYVQLKGTSKKIQGEMFPVPVNTQTLRYWKQKLAPVMLVLADVEDQRCYFQWFDKSTEIPADTKQVTLHIPRENEWAAARVVLSLRPYYEDWRTQLNDKAIRSFFRRLFCDASSVQLVLTRAMSHILFATPDSVSTIRERNLSVVLNAVILFVQQITIARRSIVMTQSPQSERIDAFLKNLNTLLYQIYSPVGDVNEGWSLGLVNDEEMFRALPTLVFTIGEIVSFLQPHVVGDSFSGKGDFRVTEPNNEKSDVPSRDIQQAFTDTLEKQNIFACPLTTQLLFIDTLYSFFEPYGFKRSELPLITEQYGDPPMFSELRRLGESNPYQSSALESLSIEQILGRYVASNEQVTLFGDGIRWCSSKMEIPEGLLRFVVLVHVFAHWAVHRLPISEAVEFSLEYYEDSENEFHETLAQLLTYFVSKNLHPSFRKAFNTLNLYLAPIYTTYQRYEEISPEVVIMSIVDARRRTGPSTYLNLSEDISRREAQQ